MTGEFILKLYDKKTGELVLYSDLIKGEDLEKAIDGYKSLRKSFRIEAVALVPLSVEVDIEKQCQCDMSDEDLKKFNETIMKMNDDLSNIIDYDEWAAREYGETRVDYYGSALALYAAGYRKVLKGDNNG